MIDENEGKLVEKGADIVLFEGEVGVDDDGEF